MFELFSIREPLKFSKWLDRDMKIFDGVFKTGKDSCGVGKAINLGTNGKIMKTTKIVWF